jgi:SP family general alpha glucoside:H+ symporter-like MFS transporter
MDKADITQAEHVQNPQNNETGKQALGRAVQEQEKKQSWAQTLRRDPWLLFWAGLMLWTMIVRGFENQASGTVVGIPVFKKKFGELQPNGQYFVDTKWLSALNGGSVGASIIGSWVGSWLADEYGTKPVLLCATALNIASVAVEFASGSIEMFFGGKLMNFIAIGTFLSVCTAYISDIAPIAIRATLIGFCNLSQCIGPFIAAIMANSTAKWETDWAWKSLITAQWGFATVAFIGQIFMPESPVFLVKKARFAEAQKSLERMYTNPLDAEAHCERIRLTLNEAETAESEGSYLDCFRGTNLRRTLIASMVFLSEPMSGLGFIGSYGALMYQYVGISESKSFELQIGGQVLSISGATIALLLSDFVGRRPNYIGGCVCLSLLLICMAISGSIDTKSAVLASVGFYTMFNFFYNVGIGSTVYAIAGEVPTSVLRSKTLAIAMSLSNAFNTFWSFVTPYIFNEDYANLKAKIGFIFGAIMLVFVVLGWFFLPETKRRSYEELDELFGNKVPARKFKTYVTVAEQRALEAYDAKRAKSEMY